MRLSANARALCVTLFFCWATSQAASQYQGPPLGKVAVVVHGADQFGEKLAQRVAADLQEYRVNAVDVSAMRRLTPDEGEFVDKLRAEGFTEVLAIVAQAEHGMTPMYNMMEKQMSMGARAELLTIAGKDLWAADVSASSAGGGRGGRLIRGISARIIRTLRADGIIVPARK